MAKASIAIDLFERQVKKYQRRLEMIRYFEAGKKDYYELKCTPRYGSQVTSTILVKVKGYITESVSVNFYAGDGDVAEGLNIKRWRFINRSVKYESIVSYKRVPAEDLPLYIGCKQVSQDFSSEIKGVKSNG